jgi:V/A-type H+-transporting ATPase subunit A
MLTTIQTFNDEAFDALEAGVPVDEIIDIDAAPNINRIGVQEDYEAYVDELKSEITEQLRSLY